MSTLNWSDEWQAIARAHRLNPAELAAELTDEQLEAVIAGKHLPGSYGFYGPVSLSAYSTPRLLKPALVLS